MSVVVPPSMAAKERGMSSFEADWPVSPASFTVRGRSTATTAVLFTNAESPAAVPMRAKASRQGPPRASPVNRRPRAAAAPVRVSPPASMSMASTVTVAGLAKPDTASSGVTRPVRARVTSTRRDTRSMRTRPETNSAMARTVMAPTARRSVGTQRSARHHSTRDRPDRRAV